MKMVLRELVERRAATPAVPEAVREALEFYADPANWTKSEDAWGWLLMDDEEGPKRAAAALAALEGSGAVAGGEGG